MLPLLLCIFDIFPNIDRFMRLVNSTSFVPSELLVFLAVVKGLFIVFGYTIQNSRVRRYFMCRFWKSDEWSNMERIYSSFSDDDEEGETTMSRTSAYDAALKNQLADVRDAFEALVGKDEDLDEI